jgi:hypothetical protein
MQATKKSLDTSKDLNESINEVIQSKKHLPICIPIRDDSVFSKPALMDNKDYELSARLINDENKEIQTNRTLETNRYNFINTIKEEIKYRLIDTKKFLQLHENAMFNILGYCYDSYEKIINANKVIRNKIQYTLNARYNRIITEFRNMYKEYLELQEFYFKPRIISNTCKYI